MAPGPADREPLAARLHVVPRVVNLVQRPLVQLLRGWLVRSPHWVLLGTRGRRTGLVRETLLPCLRGVDGLPQGIVVISTYGFRSDWLRNLRADPAVTVTIAGRTVPGRAEIVTEAARKDALVRGRRIFLPFPSRLTNALVGPLAARGLPHWVRPRPVVLVRPERT